MKQSKFSDEHAGDRQGRRRKELFTLFGGQMPPRVGSVRIWNVDQGRNAS
jgi:hypothetical protein